MTIGDDIFTILGMMPIRDRAGIQRATMADEAMKASGGNAEGQQLTMQGQGPPQLQLPPMGRPPQGDVQLPDDVPTSYASGRAASTKPELRLPPPIERTVAASPAAAPSPEVSRGSDMILAEMEKRKRAEDMNGVFASLGLLANAFNRSGSADSTRTALAGEAFGGGSKAPSVAEMIALQKLRGDENTAANEAVRRKQAIDTAQRMFGYGPELAALKYDNGTLTEELKPENMRKRSEDERAGKTRMDLAKPGVVAEIAKRTGMPVEVVEADIRSGKIGQKEIADILHTQAQTGKVGADTAKTVQETEEARKSNAAFTFYKDNPEAFARLHRIPLEQAQSIVSDRKNYDKYQETSGPTAYAAEAGFAAAQRGGYKGTREDWEKIQAPAKESPDEKARAELLVGSGKRFIDKDEPAARETEKNISVVNHNAQNLWSDNLITGAGQLSVVEEKGRRLAAKLLGYDPKDVEDTQLFFNARKADALKMRGTDMPGAMSDADREFLTEIAGNRDMSGPTLKRLMMIQEKYQRALLEKHNDEVRRRKTNNPTVYRDIEEIPQPELGRFLREALATPGGQRLLQHLRANPTDKTTVRRFEEEFGKGMAKKFVNEGASGG